MNGKKPLRPIDYWRTSSGLTHITPGGEPLPEGKWFDEYMRNLGTIQERVVDFGCGPGRLAGYFDKGLYLGVDVNPLAVVRARERNPDHNFILLLGITEFPDGDLYLCHTVLLHIPDADLIGTIERFKADKVIVQEIIGRGWRRNGNPPVFNRDADDYIDAFGRCGYANTSYFERPYEHYKKTKLGILHFERGL